MTPTVGRIVHYVAYGTPGGEYPPGVCRAAVVTAVDTLVAYRPGQGEALSDARGVDLCVLNPSGVFFDQGLLQDEDGHRPGSWHWPERVDDAGIGG